MDICIIKYSINDTVTGYYLDIVADAFGKLGYSCEFVWSVEEALKTDAEYIVASICTDACKIRLKRRKYIYWAQGIWPEENFMKHHDPIRYIGYSIIERVALKNSQFSFFVSRSLKEHYEKKYHIAFDDKFYIMPCSNEKFHENSFYKKDKYKNNIFCYAGSTNTWQCFDETLKLYKRIENIYSDSKILILVKDKEYAQKKVDEYGIQNYEIDFVAIEELENRLVNVKFGFVLRRPSSVNSVATPTKISTYICNGIIPIYSNCLKGVSELLDSTEYKVIYHNNDSIVDIERIMKYEILSQQIHDSYYKIYENKYERNKHISLIVKTISKFFS